uniref:RVP_2 domain-containing protein n=1 Tax=Populus alba TaxID=43335 RepID=A0A4U5P416_POPAL|nr:hypothetical protein D5086_0000235640 [Populus alba]
MQTRRAQGLCFHCNDRFTTGYRCKKPQLLLLKGQKDVVECKDTSVQQASEVNQDIDVVETQEPAIEPEITLQALTGWSTPKVMRMIAKIGHLEAIVLIDSGLTHNFTSECLASMLRMLVVSVERFIVRVANGKKTCQRSFNKVLVDLQGTKFYLKLFSLPLSGLDLVLGIQWLEMLGSMVCNLKLLTIDFIWDNYI